MQQKLYCGISKGTNTDLLNLLAILEITTVKEMQKAILLVCLYL